MNFDSISTMFKLDHNDNKVRSYSLDVSIHRSRSPSMSSSKCDKEYHIHIQRESDRMVEDNNDTKPANSISSIRLEYVTQEGQNNQVGKVADTSLNIKQQHVPTAGPILNSLSGENVFNVQLNYDPDQALDSESWDGNFHAISLHRSMEHIASDVLSIKKSLLRIKKYISDKSINGDKANDFKDLSGMGKSIWEFISLVYDSHWNVLFVDENNMTLRNKVKSKFALQVKFPQTLNKDKDTPKPTFVSSIPSSIPAKSPNKVKEISKFFKKIEKPTTKKSYAQASTSKPHSSDKSSNIVMNTLKIKETFPNLPNNKINSI